MSERGEKPKNDIPKKVSKTKTKTKKPKQVRKRDPTTGWYLPNHPDDEIPILINGSSRCPDTGRFIPKDSKEDNRELECNEEAHSSQLDSIN
jgi:hypothetical protein